MDIRFYPLTIDDCADPFDSDGDGVYCSDNCPFVANANQDDQDHDRVGDQCDNCIYAPNPEQENDDGDATGNLCDGDDDNDGVGE